MAKMTKAQENGLKVKALLNSGFPVTVGWKWTVSKGRYTYGYNICTCLADGLKLGQCDGGGYDMRGFTFGEFLNNAFAEELAALDKEKEYYGLRQYGGKVDGACGLSCMQTIFEALGYEMTFHRTARGDEEYIVRRKADGKENHLH